MTCHQRLPPPAKPFQQLINVKKPNLANSSGNAATVLTLSASTPISASAHCKPTPPPQGVAYCRVRRTQSSPSVRLSSFPRDPSLQPLFAVTDHGCFLELGVRRLCLLSRASVAVCLPFKFASSFSCRLRSRSLPFTFARRSLFAFTRRSPFEFAFVFVWKPRCSASNTATNPRAPPSRRTALFCHRPACTTLIMAHFNQVPLAAGDSIAIFSSLNIRAAILCRSQLTPVSCLMVAERRTLLHFVTFLVILISFLTFVFIFALETNFERDILYSVLTFKNSVCQYITSWPKLRRPRCRLTGYICIGIELGILGGFLVVKTCFGAILIELGRAVICVVRLPWVIQSDQPRCNQLEMQIERLLARHLDLEAK
ncbi:uncharacterized protein LOC130963139 [Arachis stenosperma]|uniref:uncharacterized protein LOC130963139 n=1 Tax=Arachis stenosperma TaxID=217475 RepID=UPI0025ACD579|nr:uncharacterized protein LOC130963139 [Arachis stenosperma]